MIIVLLFWVYMVEYRGMISGELFDFVLIDLYCYKFIDLVKSYIEYKINEND